MKNKYMNEIETQLLENIFDALDRLFDKKYETIDLYALIYASDKALGKSFEEIHLGEYSTNLNKIIRSGESEHAQREQALKVINTLRNTLNQLLEF